MNANKEKEIMKANEEKEIMKTIEAKYPRASRLVKFDRRWRQYNLYGPGFCVGAINANALCNNNPCFNFNNALSSIKPEKRHCQPTCERMPYFSKYTLVRPIEGRLDIVTADLRIKYEEVSAIEEYVRYLESTADVITECLPMPIADEIIPRLV